MRLERLSPKPDGLGRYLLRFSDGSTRRLYRQTIEDFGLYAGMELSQEELTALEESAGEMSAKMRAVRIVTASNVSKRDLERRLTRKGETPENARAAVSWMAELELVDDEKTARQIVERCIARGYGPARARQMLYEKQIPREFWDEALEDYPDQSHWILDYLRTHLGENPDEKQTRRAIDALLRRGHSFGDIHRVLGDISEFEE